MTLFQHYKNAVIYPSLIVIVVMTVFAIIDNHDYKSEWFTAESVIFMSIITGVIYSLIICGLALSIFLNKYEKIKSSKTLSALTWFLLPLGCVAIFFIHDINLRLKFESNFGTDFIYVLLMNIPFIFGLIGSFIKFRKSN